ncbi:MAG: NAD(P)H-hydrate dehydratase [Rickettsiales bacterium]|nr:NAD(P)H-hydrate dehydratase [Rickettsiales bacterium]
MRESNSHKGDFGHVLIIGGDYGMGGAVIMAAEAAYRVGAGKVTLLTRKENFAPLLARLPNAMTVADETLTEDVLANKSVIVIGCGLGKSKWARDLLKIVLSSNLPKVIDADALNIISESKKIPNLKNAIITPHISEASRLLKISTAEIEKDREIAVKKLHEKYGAVAVLKGSGTLVFGKERGIYRCQYGNSGMATAGMGDVLSGIIGGLMAQHLDNIHSATYGVNIHAFAGDLAAKKQGEVGMMPQDLFIYIPQVINNKF